MTDDELRVEVENFLRQKRYLAHLQVSREPPAPDIILTDEQKQRIGEILGANRVFQDLRFWRKRPGQIKVEVPWPDEERLTAKALLGLAQELGFSDVQVKPDGIENEDLVLIFVK